MQTTEIKIYGKPVRIRGDEPAKVIEYADFLESYLKRMENTLNSVDPTQLYLITALNIVAELFAEKEDNTRLQDEIKRVNNQLQSFLSDNKL